MRALPTSPHPVCVDRRLPSWSSVWRSSACARRVVSRWTRGRSLASEAMRVITDQAVASSKTTRRQRERRLRLMQGGLVDAQAGAPTSNDAPDASAAQVTGTLVSAAAATNYPTLLGLDFMLLPNPNAATAYTAGQLPIGHGWRLRAWARGTASRRPRANRPDPAHGRPSASRDSGWQLSGCVSGRFRHKA